MRQGRFETVTEANMTKRQQYFDKNMFEPQLIYYLISILLIDSLKKKPNPQNLFFS